MARVSSDANFNDITVGWREAPKFCGWKSRTPPLDDHGHLFTRGRHESADVVLVHRNPPDAEEFAELVSRMGWSGFKMDLPGGVMCVQQSKKSRLNRTNIHRDDHILVSRTLANPDFQDRVLVNVAGLILLGMRHFVDRHKISGLLIGDRIVAVLVDI